MKRLILFLLTMFMLSGAAFAQGDCDIPEIFLPGKAGDPVTGGMPDIFLPIDPVLGSPPAWYSQDPLADLPQLLMLVHDPDTDQPSYMVLTLCPGAAPPDGPVTTPPPLGYWWGPSTPEGGTDYWKFTGKLADGTPYEIWMQQYMAPGLHVEDKCNKAKDAINMASDYHTSGKDPVNAEVNGETGKVEVKPNEGCTIDSSELENGSQQAEDETGEISDGPEPAPEKAMKKSYRLVSLSLTGVPSGETVKGEVSSISFGVGPYKFSTYVDPAESNKTLLRKFKLALWQLGINAKFCTDQNGEKHLLFFCPFPSLPYGTTDTGIRPRLIMTRTESPDLNSGQTYTVGTKKLMVDPDEAMPHYMHN